MKTRTVMVHISCLLVLCLFLLPLCGCFWRFFGTSKTFPDMVEYTEEEVLAVAAEKYDLIKIYEGSYEVFEYGHGPADGAFGTNLSFAVENPDNAEAALSSFAGKNGGHDIQGRFNGFRGYYTPAVDKNGNRKILFYNLNIHKDAAIADTVGVCDYPADLLPDEIPESLYDNVENSDMRLYLNKHFPTANSTRGYRIGEHLTRHYTTGREGEDSFIRYYKEGDRVVFDLVSDPEGKGLDGSSEQQTVFSTSDRYGTCHMYYGLDVGELFDCTYTYTEQAPGVPGVGAIDAHVKLREGYAADAGEICYIFFWVRRSYYIEGDSGPVITEDTVRIRGETRWDKVFYVKPMEGIDHAESTDIRITDFYIFYEKKTG